MRVEVTDGDGRCIARAPLIGSRPALREDAYTTAHAALDEAGARVGVYTLTVLRNNDTVVIIDRIDVT